MHPPPPPPPPLVVDGSPESVGCTGSEGVDPIGPWLCDGAGVFAGMVVPLVVQCCKLDLQHGLVVGLFPLVVQCCILQHGLVEGLVAPFTVGREGLCGGC